MRIAYFTDTYHPQINGVTYTVASWKDELEDRGHDVYVVYPESGYGNGPRELPVPSRPVRIVDNYNLGLSFPGDLSARLPETDAVHVHGPFSMGVLGKAIARRDSSPVFATHHTPINHYFDYLSEQPHLQSALEKLYAWWEKRFYRDVDHVFAPSRYTARNLETQVSRTVHPLSNGIDTEFFSPEDTGFLGEHGVEAERVIGFCGRLGYEKHLEDLVEVSRRFDGEVVVAGDGFAKDHYLEMFGERGNVTYLGRLERGEMPLFYSSLDVFVIPSTAETQGVSVLEANACGTPAVGADALALKETIEEGVNGYRYPQGDIEALEEAIRRAVNRGMEASSRERAVEHSVESTVSELERFYRGQ